MYSSNLLWQCLDFARQLTGSNQEGFVNVRIGDFSFNFDNKKNVVNSKGKSPSQQKRDILRQKEFQNRGLEDEKGNMGECNANFNESIKPEAMDRERQMEEKNDEAEYEIKIKAHEMCKNFDIVEAIEVNFDGTLDNMKVDKEDAIRYIHVQKIREQPENELPVYRIVIKNDDVAKDIIEGWKEVHKFDDYAFHRSDLKKVRVRVNNVKKLR